MSEQDGPAGPLKGDLATDEKFDLVGQGDLLDRLVGLGQALAAFMVVAIMLGVVVGVLTRTLFNRPLVSVIELSGAGLLYITFLATAYLAKRDKHVRLEVIDELLPHRVIGVLEVVANTISLAVAALLTYASALITWRDYQAGTFVGGFLDMERWTIEIVIPVGSLLLTLQFGRTLYRRVRDLGGDHVATAD